MPRQLALSAAEAASPGIQPQMTKKPAANPVPANDSDASKGATERDENLSAQLPHRESSKAIDDLIGGSDTDFPEPGSSPEHSGEKSSAA